MGEGSEWVWDDWMLGEDWWADYDSDAPEIADGDAPPPTRTRPGGGVYTPPSDPPPLKAVVPGSAPSEPTPDGSIGKWMTDPYFLAVKDLLAGTDSITLKEFGRRVNAIKPQPWLDEADYKPLFDYLSGGGASIDPAAVPGKLATMLDVQDQFQKVSGAKLDLLKANHPAELAAYKPFREFASAILDNQAALTRIQIETNKYRELLKDNEEMELWLEREYGYPFRQVPKGNDFDSREWQDFFQKRDAWMKLQGEVYDKYRFYARLQGDASWIEQLRANYAKVKDYNGHPLTNDAEFDRLLKTLEGLAGELRFPSQYHYPKPGPWDPVTFTGGALARTVWEFKYILPLKMLSEEQYANPFDTLDPDTWTGRRNVAMIALGRQYTRLSVSPTQRFIDGFVMAGIKSFVGVSDLINLSLEVALDENKRALFSWKLLSGQLQRELVTGIVTETVRKVTSGEAEDWGSLAFDIVSLAPSPGVAASAGVKVVRVAGMTLQTGEKLLARTTVRMSKKAAEGMAEKAATLAGREALIEAMTLERGFVGGGTPSGTGTTTARGTGNGVAPAARRTLPGHTEWVPDPRRAGVAPRELPGLQATYTRETGLKPDIARRRPLGETRDAGFDPATKEIFVYDDVPPAFRDGYLAEELHHYQQVRDAGHLGKSLAEIEKIDPGFAARMEADVLGRVRGSGFIPYDPRHYAPYTDVPRPPGVAGDTPR